VSFERKLAIRPSLNQAIGRDLFEQVRSIEWGAEHKAIDRALSQYAESVEAQKNDGNAEYQTQLMKR
jgi:hypothetical protein